MTKSYRIDPNFKRTIPSGDNLERSVCAECGFIDYQNPKIVVGSVVMHESRVLLCRRSIEPRRGYWTLPAGYLEIGESAEEGARREAREEANADIEIDRGLGGRGAGTTRVIFVPLGFLVGGIFRGGHG